MNVVDGGSQRLVASYKLIMLHLESDRVPAVQYAGASESQQGGDIIPQSSAKAQRRDGQVGRGTQPDAGQRSVFVNVAHDRHLLCSLIQIVLVDANGVDPVLCRRPGRSERLQRMHCTNRRVERFAIEDDALLAR